MPFCDNRGHPLFALVLVDATHFCMRPDLGKCSKNAHEYTLYIGHVWFFLGQLVPEPEYTPYIGYMLTRKLSLCRGDILIIWGIYKDALPLVGYTQYTGYVLRDEGVI